MSFGFSVSDFVTLGQLAWTVYKGFRDAPEGFERLSKEVASFYAVIKEVEECVSGEALSNSRQARRKTIIDCCSDTLEDLWVLVEKYGSLNTRTKRTMGRVRFGQENIAEFRSRLTSNTALLTA